MKTNIYKYTIGLLMAGGVFGGFLSSCQDEFYVPDLGNQVPHATMESNTTLLEFKNAYKDELAVMVPYKDQEAKIPYILKGRVISSDASGNIYKSLVIQDETTALALSINQSSMYLDYRLGQEVLLNATDLWMGQYSDLLQLGSLGDYNGKPQITFMTYDSFKAHSEMNGEPDRNFVTINYGDEHPADNPYCIRISLDQLVNGVPVYSEGSYELMSQLVEIPEVRFEDAGKTPPVTYSIYQDNANRKITDASGAELIVRNSGYSSFYNEPLPEGLGTLRGILSVYQGSWQLLLRGLDDVIGFTTKGKRDDPFDVSEVIALQNSGREAWMEGYIIGSVKSGVAEVTSISDINFNVDDTDMVNNLVIADKPDCRNINEMMVIELPADSKIRRYANLLDNPEVYGHKILVLGSFNEYLGMHGVTNVGNGLGAFSIEGINVGGLDGLGSGTEADPFKPSYVVKVAEDINDVWVEGYIVGFIEGKNYNTGANFNDDFEDKDFGGNNFILGDAADTTSPDNAVPVNLTKSPFRDALDLTENPDVFGKKVLIKGNITKTFNVYGINTISEVKFLN